MTLGVTESKPEDNEVAVYGRNPLAGFQWVPGWVWRTIKGIPLVMNG